MQYARVLVFLAVISWLGACGEKPSEPKPAASEGKSVFDPQLRALDRARGVEQTLEQGAQAQQKSIDEAGK